MIKNKKLLTILSVVLFIILSLSAVVIPLVVNAGGGGGAGGGFDGGGIANSSAVYGYLYEWYDDPTFNPKLDAGKAPAQGWYTRTNTAKDAAGNYLYNTCAQDSSGPNSYDYWINLLCARVNNLLNDGKSYRPVSEHQWGNSVDFYGATHFEDLKESMREACENALARDKQALHARVVGIATTWSNQPEKDGQGPYWFLSSYNSNNPSVNTFVNLFGQHAPNPSDFYTVNGTNYWGTTVDASRWNDTNGTETWAQYIWRMGQLDNQKSPKAIQWYVVAVTDNMPSSTEYEGYVQVKKTNKSGYSVVGATFGIYSDAACTKELTKVTITSGSSTTPYKIALGSSTSKDVWVKELSAPTNTNDFTWNIDDTPKKVTVTSNTTATSPAIVSINNTVTEYGYLQIHKDVPTKYQPTGAQYTVYTSYTNSTNNTIAKDVNGNSILEINSNGESNILKFAMPEGTNSLTFYVKETRKPTQKETDFDWSMDKTLYTVTVLKESTQNNPIRIASKNDVTEYGYGTIKKFSDVPSQQDKVDGAEFTLYDSEGNIAKAYIPGSPDTPGKDVVLTIKDGTSEKFCLKAGTYKLVETKVPEGFEKVDDRTITINKGDDKTFNVTNHFKKAYVYINKLTDRGDKLDKYPLEGTKIGIYIDEDCTILAVDVLTEKPCILTVQKNMKTETVCLGLGKYYVKEISTTPWYDLNTEIVPIELIEDQSELDQPYNFNYNNTLKKGLGKVEKGFK